MFHHKHINKKNDLAKLKLRVCICPVNAKKSGLESLYPNLGHVSSLEEWKYQGWSQEFCPKSSLESELSILSQFKSKMTVMKDLSSGTCHLVKIFT